jgi:uncharacterized Zn-binding protein involved in type VI secretion
MMVARKGDLVFFPKCGVFPIVGGNPMFLDIGQPLAHIGDGIACGGVIISGNPKFMDGGRPVSHFGDKGVCPKCGTGIIITGSPLFLDV